MFTLEHIILSVVISAIGLLIVFLERLWWWNPLIWLLGRHARQCMEYACDERCKSLLGMQSYRRSLAEILLQNQSSALPCTISIGTKSDIIQRMENIEMNYKFTSKHALVCVMAALQIPEGSEEFIQCASELLGISFNDG